jgi:hypothetical protein
MFEACFYQLKITVLMQVGEDWLTFANRDSTIVK